MGQLFVQKTYNELLTPFLEKRHMVIIIYIHGNYQQFEYHIKKQSEC